MPFLVAINILLSGSFFEMRVICLSRQITSFYLPCPYEGMAFSISICHCSMASSTSSGTCPRLYFPCTCITLFSRYSKVKYGLSGSSFLRIKTIVVFPFVCCSRGSVAKFKIKIIFPNNSIIYAGIPKSTLISMQTEKPKRVPSFRLFLYKPRIASMPLIVVEAVRKL